MSIFVKIFPYDFTENGSAIVGIRCKRKDIGKRRYRNKLQTVCQGIYDFDRNVFTVVKGISKICDEQVAKDGYTWYDVLIEALDKHDWSDNVCFINRKKTIWKRKNGVDL